MNTPFVDVLAQEITPDAQKKYFVRPPRIQKLISTKSSIIIGERGCGKTTVLRHLEDYFNITSDSLDYIGIYHRFETARSRALINPDFNEDMNIKVFSQEIAALIITKLCAILSRFRKKNKLKLCNEEKICRKISYLVEYKEVEYIKNLEELGELFEFFRSKTVVNTQNDRWVCYFDYTSILSTFCLELRKQEELCNTCFCILFDEFENLSHSQQRVVNSFIKGATYYLTYKVCMRPEGFLTRNTLSDTEDIREIDDYEELQFVDDIIGNEKTIADYLKRICSNRLRYFYDQEKITYKLEDLDVENYLEVLSDVEIIGNWDRISEYKDELRKELMDIYPNRIDEISSINDVIKLRLIKVLREKKKTEKEIFGNSIYETEVYKNWKHNYKNNVMYMIVSECEQEKKYCGFNVFIKLANSNTRRVLEMLHYAFGDYNNYGHVYKQISVNRQTNAVKKLSKSYFEQIGAIPLNGYKVKNLAFSLGSLFAKNMQDGRVKKFEVNSFAITTTHALSESQLKELKIVLHDSIVWGVLIPFQANKIKNRGDMVLDGRDLELHPLLSPYFQFSYRKRQKNGLPDYIVYSMLSTITNKEIESVSKEINTKYIQGTLWGSEDEDF